VTILSPLPALPLRTTEDGKLVEPMSGEEAISKRFLLLNLEVPGDAKLAGTQVHDFRHSFDPVLMGGQRLRSLGGLSTEGAERSNAHMSASYDRPNQRLYSGTYSAQP
jgi:hypothetical protein